MAEVMVATVRAQVLLSLAADFENFRTFNPGHHPVKELHTMLDQLVAWAVRSSRLRIDVAEEAATA